MKLSTWAPVAFLFLAVPALAQNVATIKFVAPPTMILRPGSLTRVKPGDPLRINDVLVTGPEGRALIVLQDASEVTLGPRTEIRVAIHDPEKQQTLIEMLHGRVRTKVTPVTKQGGFFKVATPTAIAYALGSELLTETVNPVVDTSEPTLTALVLKHNNQQPQKQQASNNPLPTPSSSASTPEANELAEDISAYLDNLTYLPPNVTPPNLNGSENALDSLTNVQEIVGIAGNDSLASQSPFGSNPASFSGTSAMDRCPIEICRTSLLYPFVTNQTGFDTGLTIRDTSVDVFDSYTRNTNNNLIFTSPSFTAPVLQTFLPVPPPLDERSEYEQGLLERMRSRRTQVAPAPSPTPESAANSFTPSETQPQTFTFSMADGSLTITINPLNNHPASGDKQVISGSYYTWTRTWKDPNGAVTGSVTRTGTLPNYPYLSGTQWYFKSVINGALSMDNPNPSAIVLPQFNSTTHTFNALQPFATPGAFTFSLPGSSFGSTSSANIHLSVTSSAGSRLDASHFFEVGATPGELKYGTGYRVAYCSCITCDDPRGNSILLPGTFAENATPFYPLRPYSSGLGSFPLPGLSGQVLPQFDPSTQSFNALHPFIDVPSSGTMDWRIYDNVWGFTSRSQLNFTGHSFNQRMFVGNFSGRDWPWPSGPLANSYRANDNWTLSRKLALITGTVWEPYRQPATIAPRTGFAYSPQWGGFLTGHGKTAFRGGYRMLYDPPFYNIDLNQSPYSPSASLGFEKTFLDGSSAISVRVSPPKSVVRMGYGVSYDIGVFGSNFGHSVTQNLPVLGQQSLVGPPLGLSDFSYLPIPGNIDLNDLVQQSLFFTPTVFPQHERKTILRASYARYADQLQNSNLDMFGFGPDEIDLTNSLPGLTTFTQRHGLIGILSTGLTSPSIPAKATLPTGTVPFTSVDTLLDVPPGQLGPNFKLPLFVPVHGTLVTPTLHYAGVVGRQGSPLYLNTLQSAYVPLDGAPAEVSVLFDGKNATLQLQPVSDKVPGSQAIAEFDQITASLSRDNFTMNGQPCVGEVMINGVSNSPNPKLKLTVTGNATSTPLTVGHATNSGTCPGVIIITNGAALVPSHIIGKKTGGLLKGLAGAAIGATTGVAVIPVGELKDYQDGTSSGVTFTVPPSTGKDVESTLPEEPGKGGGKEPSEPKPNEVLVPIRSFCLDLHKLAPHPQTAYKFADENKQKQLGPYGHISNDIFRGVQSGEVKLPPGHSLDSATQWTIWAVREGLDAKKFTEEYLHIVEKNLHAQNKKMDKDTKAKMEQSAAQLFSFVQHFLAGAPKS